MMNAFTLHYSEIVTVDRKKRSNERLLLKDYALAWLASDFYANRKPSARPIKNATEE